MTLVNAVLPPKLPLNHLRWSEVVQRRLHRRLIGKPTATLGLDKLLQMPAKLLGYLASPIHGQPAADQDICDPVLNSGIVTHERALPESGSFHEPETSTLRSAGSVVFCREG